MFDEGKRWLVEGQFPAALNNMNIVLIPMIDNPQSVRDLRPISLCNVVYKIIYKVLYNRLKAVYRAIKHNRLLWSLERFRTILLLHLRRCVP